MNNNKEIFIPGPSGRIQAKYFKSKQQGAPVALVLHPHPQYGGTMNNRIVSETHNCFYKNNFSVIRINFRGVEKSDGVFDNGQGELSDAAAALDWIEKENPGASNSVCSIPSHSSSQLVFLNNFSSLLYIIHMRGHPSVGGAGCSGIRDCHPLGGASCSGIGITAPWRGLGGGDGGIILRFSYAS